MLRLFFNISKHIKAPLNVDQHQERARGDYMELEYFPSFPTPLKRGKKRGYYAK